MAKKTKKAEQQTVEQGKLAAAMRELFGEMAKSLKDLILGRSEDDTDKEIVDLREKELAQFYKNMEDENPYDFAKEEKKKNAFARVIDTVKKCFVKNKLLFFTNLFYIFCFLDVVRMVASDLVLIFAQKKFMLHSSMSLSILIPATGVMLWLYASDEDFYAYQGRKLAAALLIITDAFLWFFQPLFNYVYSVLVPVVQSLKTSIYFTENTKQEFIAYLAILIPAIFIFLVCNMLLPIILDILPDLSSFKLSYAIDKREFADTSYDQSTIKNLTTGKPLTVYEKDRFLAGIIIGPSGTAKTSSLIAPGICQDLDRKIENDDKREKALANFVADKKGKLVIPEGTPPDVKFRNEWVVPYRGHKREYNYICRRYQSCGVIVLAPDDEFCDNVADLAIARGITPRYLDPTLVYSGGEKSERIQKYEKYLCGINLFAIPKGLSLGVEAEYVARTSLSFASIAQSVSEKRKSGDEYFSNVTKTVAQTAAAVEMLWYKYCSPEKRDCTFHEVSEACNNFKIIVKHTRDLKDKVFGDGSKDTPYLLKDVSSYETFFNSVEINFTATTIKVGTSVRETKPKFEENSSGLRMALQELEASPGVISLFTAENTINIDDSLKYGDVIIVNFPLSISETAAVGWGLTFQLTLKEAITRRDSRKDASIPVFEWVDELPTIAGEWVGTFVALARKYSLGFVGAMQSLDQLDRNENTKFLKTIVTSVGTQYIYGRSSITEMDVYSKLSGVKMVEQSISTRSYASFLSPETKENLSVRTQETEEEKMTASDIRFGGFQELTFLQSKNGHILRGVKAKSSFLPRDAYAKKTRPRFDWRAYAKKLAQEDTYLESEVAATQLKLQLSAPEDENREQILSTHTFKSERVVAETAEPIVAPVAPTFAKEQTENLSALFTNDDGYDDGEEASKEEPDVPPKEEPDVPPKEEPDAPSDEQSEKAQEENPTISPMQEKEQMPVVSEASSETSSEASEEAEETEEDYEVEKEEEENEQELDEILLRCAPKR